MKNRTVALVLAMSFFGASSGFAVAQTDPSKFPLSKAIPDDVFIAVSAKANPERKFLDDYWAEVIKAFVDSGVMTDVWDMVTDTVPDDKLDEVEDTMDRFSGLCEKIEWSEMFDREFVYCGRFNPANAPDGFHEGMFIGRSNKEKSSANYSALKKMLAELVKFVNEQAGQSVVNLDETKGEGQSVAKLVFGAAPNFGISVAQMDDVIFLSFGGPDLLKDGMSLLKGGGDKKGITSSPRFKQAFDQLPPAEDSMVFFDVEGMMSTFRTMLAAFGADMHGGPPRNGGGHGAREHAHDEDGEHGEDGESHADGEDEGESDAHDHGHDEVNPMQIVSQLMHDISIIDYVAESEWTDGHRVFTDSVTVLKTSAKSSPIYDVVTSGKPTANFEKFIPKEAVSFSVSSGVDLTKAYQYAIDFVTKVTDEKRMNEQLTRLLTFVNQQMGESALIISKVKVNDKVEFKQISHPMMAMMPGVSPPVIGCADGQLLLGSSVKTIKTCLMTASGKHDNITKNKRWQEESLMPTGSVLRVSFTDESNMGQELQAAIGGMSMGLGMMGMFMGGDVPPEAKRVISAIGPILAKLGPVAGRLDFFKSNAAYESFDGKKWTAHAVQNYKKQSERPARMEETDTEAESSDSSNGSGESDADSE
ncbi:MAG: hypothetical protein IPK83_03395 [Planctomycetes bacterium]|nr:hypothetical protein [Planctomycetota bacterium]